MSEGVEWLLAGESGFTSNRAYFKTFIPSVAVAEGQSLCFDASKSGADRTLYVVPSDAADPAKSIFAGIATEAGVADKTVRAVTKGYYGNAIVPAATVQGDVFQIGATAGELDIYDVAITQTLVTAGYNDLPKVAMALEDDTAGRAAVVVL